jgi:hypothetical protein
MDLPSINQIGLKALANAIQSSSTNPYVFGGSFICFFSRTVPLGIQRAFFGWTFLLSRSGCRPIWLAAGMGVMAVLESVSLQTLGEDQNQGVFQRVITQKTSKKINQSLTTCNI